MERNKLRDKNFIYDFEYYNTEFQKLALLTMLTAFRVKQIPIKRVPIINSLTVSLMLVPVSKRSDSYKRNSDKRSFWLSHLFFIAPTFLPPNPFLPRRHHLDLSAAQWLPLGQGQKLEWRKPPPCVFQVHSQHGPAPSHHWPCGPLPTGAGFPLQEVKALSQPRWVVGGISHRACRWQGPDTGAWGLVAVTPMSQSGSYRDAFLQSEERGQYVFAPCSKLWMICEESSQTQVGNRSMNASLRGRRTARCSSTVKGGDASVMFYLRKGGQHHAWLSYLEVIIPWDSFSWTECN